MAGLPWMRMLCSFFFDSIDTSIGNDNYPGPVEAYGSFVDSLDRIWVGTYLPIYVVLANDGYSSYVDFGANQYGPGPPYTGDRGEIYSWVERAPGEVWCGAYSAEDRVMRMCGSTRAGFSYDAQGIDRRWRPRGSCSDGTLTYWGIGPVSRTVGEFGGILAVDADGVGTKHADIVNGDIMSMEYDAVNDKIMVLASGEGIEGTDPGAYFHQVEPSTMAVDLSVWLGGDRGLSLHQLDDDLWFVVSHLTSSTEARIQVVSTAGSGSRLWVKKFDGSDTPAAGEGYPASGPPIPIYGRVRKSIVELDGTLYTVSDNHILEIDVDGQDLIPRCRIPRTKDTSGAYRPTNLVGHSGHGLVMAHGNRVWAWDPR